MASLRMPKSLRGSSNKHWGVFHFNDLYNFRNLDGGLSRSLGRGLGRSLGRSLNGGLGGCLGQYLRLNLNEISLSMKRLCPDLNLGMRYEGRGLYAGLLRKQNDLNCFYLC